jgi:hypothetical protein
MKIILPDHTVPREQYHRIYVYYIIQLFRWAGWDIKLNGIDYDGRFEFWVEDKIAIMDYSDHPTITSMWDRKTPYFKFHCHEHHIRQGILPFPPISFYDWERQVELSQEIKYTARGPYIVNRQKPYGNATERRIKVQNLLQKVFHEKALLTTNSPQESFWKDINGCYVAVFVPGCYNFMVDRGHMQYLAFGCCTISPLLRDWFPFNKQLVPGEHYIECKWDYSNLVAIIKWCMQNKERCIQIGKNAQRFFQTTCTPDKVSQWVTQCLQ